LEALRKLKLPKIGRLISNCLFVVVHVGYLRPSRELLEYYRKKISEYDSERDDMVKKMDKYKSAIEDQVGEFDFIRRAHIYG
jgi:hypothetical protein